MRLFKRDNNKNNIKQNCEEIFKTLVDNGDEYQVIYCCYKSNGVSGGQRYLVGYRENNKKLVIVPVDDCGHKRGELICLKQEDLKEARYFEDKCFIRSNKIHNNNQSVFLGFCNSRHLFKDNQLEEAYSDSEKKKFSEFIKRFCFE